MKAVVIGAGPGGLTAAIALRHAGFDATVFDRAEDLSQLHVGSGVHIWPNGMRGLRRIDEEVFESMRAVGAREEKLEIRRVDGTVVSRWPLDEFEQRFDAPTIGITRPDLLRVLCTHVGEGSLQFGAKLRGYRRLNGGVVAVFEDGREETADVLIGADGLRSRVRGQMLGDGQPRYAGYAVCPGHVDLEDERIRRGILHQVWGRGARFIFYRLPGTKVAWFAIVNADPTENPTNEERKQRLLTRFEGWHEPIPTLMASTSAESISSIPIFDRKPSDQWVDGPVTLLGDAAHPLTMNIGQGVALGIEDALELGNCLRREESVEQALEAYRRRRAERTTEIVNRSWRLGRLASTENPLVWAFRDYVLFPRFGEKFAKQIEEMMAYEV